MLRHVALSVSACYNPPRVAVSPLFVLPTLAASRPTLATHRTSCKSRGVTSRRDAPHSKPPPPPPPHAASGGFKALGYKTALNPSLADSSPETTYHLLFQNLVIISQLLSYRIRKKNCPFNTRPYCLNPMQLVMYK